MSAKYNAIKSVRSNIAAIAGLSLALVFAFGACKKEQTPTTKKDDTVKKDDTPKKDDTVKKDDTATPPAAGTPSLAEQAGEYTIDTVHSAIVFRVKRAGISYIYGSFHKMDGTVVIDADPAKSSIEINVDATKVFSGNADRDKHLIGPDFLNTAQFPKLTFKSTAIKAAGEAKYEVTGDLTMNGVTKSVTAMVEHMGGGANPMKPDGAIAGFHGTLTVKQSEFNVVYGQDKGIINDGMDLMISLLTDKK